MGTGVRNHKDTKGSKTGKDGSTDGTRVSAKPLGIIGFADYAQ